MTRALLRNFHFVSSKLSGTQEIRREMGKVGFSACVVYGAPVFMTISPSERHGGLHVRLSRYRQMDPVLQAPASEAERRWIGQDSPSLEADASSPGGDVTVELPEYELRRSILARDPLCSVDAFTVLVRIVLARLLGLRMCPECPRCNAGDHPCQDAFGSNAEPQGGIFGRCDALFGGVEAQKAGALHLHFHAFIQRVHQHNTLYDIAQMIRDELLSVGALKQYTDWVCNQSYPDVERSKSEADEVEAQWPKFEQDKRLGRIPSFVWADQGACLNGGDVPMEELRADGAEWIRRYDDAAQHVMQRSQRHVHKRGPDGVRRPLPACTRSGKPTECKHEFPMEQRLTDATKLVCPGVAEEHGLRVTGPARRLSKMQHSSIKQRAYVTAIHARVGYTW